MEVAYREDLAYIHDTGFARVARGAAALLLEELRRCGFDRGLVIDLGCGSGILSEQLSAGGFDVLGIDISSAFIDIARRRVPRGDFRVESILTAELPRCVAVAAVGECLNYLFDERHSPEGVRQVLARTFAALASGGLFLLDVAEPGRVPGKTAKSFFEGDGWAALVTSEEDRERKLLTRRITTFRKVGDLYRRDQEVHRQLLFSRTQVESWLREVGFEVRMLGAYGPEPLLSPGHVGFLARKAA
jgi:SAM-dependent methyltransferase